MFGRTKEEKLQEKLRKERQDLHQMHNILFSDVFELFERSIDLVLTPNPRTKIVYYRDGEQILTGSTEEKREKRRYLVDDIKSLNFIDITEQEIINKLGQRDYGALMRFISKTMERNEENKLSPLERAANSHILTDGHTNKSGFRSSKVAPFTDPSSSEKYNVDYNTFKPNEDLERFPVIRSLSTLGNRLPTANSEKNGEDQTGKDETDWFTGVVDEENTSYAHKNHGENYGFTKPRDRETSNIGFTGFEGKFEGKGGYKQRRTKKIRRNKSKKSNRRRKGKKSIRRRKGVKVL